MVRLIAFLTLYLVFVNVTYPTTGGVTKLSSLNILESCNKIKTEIQKSLLCGHFARDCGMFQCMYREGQYRSRGKRRYYNCTTL